MKPISLTRKKLIAKVENNQLDEVITELMHIYPPQSEKRKELVSVAFKWNTLKQDHRKGVTERKAIQVEENIIREGLYRLIRNLSEEDIFEAKFEEVFLARKKPSVARTEDKAWKQVLNKAWVNSKYVAFTLIAAILFMIDGGKLINETIQEPGSPPVSDITNPPRQSKNTDCAVNLMSIRNALEQHIIQGKLDLAFKAIKDKFHIDSDAHEVFSLLEARFNRNEERRIVSGPDQEYRSEIQIITLLFLDSSKEITCTDLT